MRLVYDTTRRFGKRPHYDPIELDRECEDIIRAHLEKQNGEITYPIGNDDLWALIESVTDDVDLADLSAWGEEVHGLTEFKSNGRPHVKIARELTEDEWRGNRLRTTITHEFGHVRFHGFLYALEMESERLFADMGRAGRDPVCKRDGILGASRDWMEWQAGYVCGALLMPANETRRLLGKELGELPGPLQRDDPRVARLALAMTLHFGVSDEAARIRLIKLGHVVPTVGMLTLPA